LKLKVFPSKLDGIVKAPPSKSYTHRAIMLAGLAEGKSIIENPLISRDTIATIDACRALGIEIEELDSSLNITGKGMLTIPQNIIDVGNSGTTLRLITAISSLISDGYTVLTGDNSIRSRPMQPLLDALNGLGVECWSTKMNGFPPIVVKGGGMLGGNVEIFGEISSQFISGILIASQESKEEVSLDIRGKQVSIPYIDSTIEIMKYFGGDVKSNPGRNYRVLGKSHYESTDFKIPGDFSSASIIIATAVLSGGSVELENLNFSLPQSDHHIVKILEMLGIPHKLEASKGRLFVSGGVSLKEGVFNLSDSPDLVPIVAALALKAEGRVVIEGVEHVRFKESDRISILSNQLRRVGCETIENKSGLEIKAPSELKGASLDAHGDHRLFMTFVAIALATGEECIIDGLESIDISYPSFLEDLRKLGGIFQVIRN